MAEPDERPFPSFREFKNSLMSANEVSTTTILSAATAGVDKLPEMKRHLVGLYQDVDAAHSFIDENGQIFDCIPVERQPALRGTASIAAPPEDPPAPEGEAKETKSAPVAQLTVSRKDRFGNTMQCPAGTVPLRRLTMEELSRFESLQGFFQKTPKGRGRHPRLSLPELASGVHKYANASQAVANTGGHSFLNIWAPAVGAQTFSLTQHWYAGGSPIQTVECGWQVYPQKYGHSKPALFTYWTPDGYASGCYNLDSRAFVQTNPSWALGGSLNTLSSDGGQQYELEVAWRLVNGNWWLYLNGTTAADAVGYYPTSLFGAGQMATNATNIDYGGETVNVTDWPSMGSGQFAKAGYGHAAYQRNVYYFTTAGGAQQATLTPFQLWPGCYTIELGAADDPWDQYFYFGGPGGPNCPEGLPA